MSTGAKAARQLWLDVDIAAFEFKDAAAIVTPEVVVMLLARHLVPLRLTRQLNSRQPVLSNKRHDVPVHRGDTQALNLFLRQRQRLFNRQGSIGCKKGRSDRLLLLGVSRHNSDVFARGLAHLANVSAS